MNEYQNRRRPAAIPTIILGMGVGLGASKSLEAATTGDACWLLTQSQVSAALGVDVDPGQRPVASDPRICNWREQGKPEGPARNVMLTLIDAKEFEVVKKLPSSTPQSGIGDDAVFSKSARLPFILSVRAGSNYLRIMSRSNATAPVDPASSSDDRDKAIDRSLALEILKKP